MKLAKLSLAALMAAGIATSANAGSLEEAIKGVEIDGFVYLRETLMQDGVNADAGIYGARFGLEIPVTDDIKANVAVDNTAIGNTASGDFFVEEASLTYTGLEGLTFIAGEQEIVTEFTDNERGFNGDYDIDHAFGLRALGEFSGINFEVASYGQSDALTASATGTDSLQYARAGMNLADIIDLSASFLRVDELGHLANLSVDGKIALSDDLELNLGAEGTVADTDKSGVVLLPGTTSGDGNLFKVYVGSNVAGIIDAKLTYGQTNGTSGINVDPGSTAALSLQSATGNVGGTGLNVEAHTNAEAWMLELATEVAPKTNVKAGYLIGNSDSITGATIAQDDFEEGLIAVEYAVADNFTTEFRVTTGYDETADPSGATKPSWTNAQLELRYDF